VRRNADSLDSLETTSLTYDVSISFFDFLNKGNRTIQMNEEINSIKLLLYKKRIYFESVAKVKTILQLDNRNVDFKYDYKFFA
jgi:hypothetical protein